MLQCHCWLLHLRSQISKFSSIYAVMDAFLCGCLFLFWCHKSYYTQFPIYGIVLGNHPCNWIDLHCHFACVLLRPAQQRRKLYHGRKWTNPYLCCQASAVFVACSKQISYCKQGTLWTRQWTGVCRTLLLDVMVPEAYQNDYHYVCELSVLSVHYTRI